MAVIVVWDGKWGRFQRIDKRSRQPRTKPKGRGGLWKLQVFSNGGIQVRSALSLLGFPIRWGVLLSASNV